MITKPLITATLEGAAFTAAPCGDYGDHTPTVFNRETASGWQLVPVPE